ncbi:MAG: HAMP domain-containing protein [Azoarcus sp.]|nr:HAMP domain-containing protein [Azoarcus sp.]
MKRLWPRSLFSRLMLIWLIGICLVLAVSIAIFINDRNQLLSEGFAREYQVWSEGFAREVSSNADILDNLSLEERHRMLDEEQGDGRRGRLRLGLSLPEHARLLPDDHPLLPALREAMPDRQIALYTYPRGEGRGPPTQRGEGRGPPRYEPLAVSVKLTDGSTLIARLRGRYPMPDQPPTLSYSYASALPGSLLALLIGVGILTWICVRIATRPLSNLSAAARALGEDPERAPLEPEGPTEVIQAAEAFNQMQQRISAHMHERTRILAAISHDLQTPITRLRLRAEMIDDATLQERIQSDLDTMQNLIREGLDYARSMEISAPAQPIDLNGLLAALTGDATDMGWAVSVTGQASEPFTGHSVALRRALWNLIENGVKFGQSVDITLSETPNEVHILVRDHGPGLPVEEIDRVFEPFYRTEFSRNRETGGTGLGLSITRNLLHVQHGNIRLGNHPEGGLLATVILPRNRSR